MFPDKNELILNHLAPAFADKISSIIAKCLKQGVEIQLRTGRRNTFEQAVLWKRSRSKDVIKEKIKELQQSNADFLAYCLFAVGEHNGTHVTNAIPGLSWHQFGLAVDCVWLLDSKICWDNENLYHGINGYKILAIESKKQGICSGHDWNSFRDSGHLQANFLSSPLELYTLETIDKLMKDKYLSLIER